MKPYWVVFTGTLQRALIYRARIFIYGFVNTFIPLLMIIIWTSYYQMGKSISGYSYSQLISYYLAVTIVSLFASTSHQRTCDDIKNGELANYVIKPFNYYFFRLAFELGGYVIKFAVFIAVTLTLFWLLKIPVSFNTTPLHLSVALVSFLLAYLLSFSSALLVGSVAFFITETTGITNLFEMLSSLATGKIFPLTFFPIAIQQLIAYTPFASMIYFPAQVIVGSLRPDQLQSGLITQLLWLIIIATSWLFVWRAGIRKFSAVGL